MSMRDFLRKNRKDIDIRIRAKYPGVRLNDNTREQWVMNDERLYRWAKAEGVKI